MRILTIHRASALLLVFVYLLTPLTALGFGGGHCDCVLKGVACGTEGFLCSCCVMDRPDCNDDRISFTRCRMNKHSNEPLVQPPTLFEPVVNVDMPRTNASIIHSNISQSLPGFKPVPLRPPAIL